MSGSYEAHGSMATHSFVPDRPLGPDNQQQMRTLRRTMTHLPVTARSQKENAVIEPIRHHPTYSSTRHVPKSETAPSRTVTNSRLPSRNAVPSVVQAQPSSATPSVQSTPSKARSLGRQSTQPPPLSTKTPSLVSGSTISTPDSPRSALRRKASTINQYALRVRTDPESMQEHRDLVKAVHQKQYDDDPFPEAIFGMTLPPTSGLLSRDTVGRSPSSSLRLPKSKSDSASRPTVDSQVPLSDVASSRNSDSPFSHQSTPTSASSHSSLAISTLGSARHRDSLDLARTAIKMHARRDIKQSTSSTDSSFRKEASKPDSLSQAKQTHNEQEQSRQKPSFTNPFSTKATYVRESYSTTLKPTTRRPSRGVLVNGIAPELAHLNVEPPHILPVNKPIPPRRPSRDGIDDLGQSQDIPIVQSNLSHIARTSSQISNDLNVISPPLSPKRTFGFSYRSSSRQSNRSQIATTSPQTPVERPETGTPLSRKDSPLVLSSPSPARSPRIGLLASRSKDSSTPTVGSEKPKKGPAAGTGHEGYGKFGFRGRGSNIFGRTSRSSSKDSLASRKGLSFLSRKKSTTSETEDDIDHFLEERREPIILRGNGSKLTSGEGEVSGSENSEPMNEARNGKRSPDLQRTMPVGSISKPPLSELGNEGKEGHWLNSPSLTKSPNFMQRFKSKINNQTSNAGSEHHLLASPIHFGSIDQTTKLDLADIEKLLSTDSPSSCSSKASDTGSRNDDPLVTYSRRHEGLLPAPPQTYSPKRSSLGSPVLLQAKTMTQMKAPHPVELSKPSGTPQQESIPQTRLRPVGRIPQVVRAGQSSMVKRGVPGTAILESPPSHDQAADPVDSIADGTQEFLSFPPRKNSELSYTSSSGLGSPCITRSSFVGEDEVWNEYDNLLDEVIPSKVRASTTSSLGAAFQYGDMIDRKAVSRKGDSTLRSSSNPEVSERASNVDTSRPSTTFSISDYLVDQEEAKSEAPVSPRTNASLQVKSSVSSPQSPRKTAHTKQERTADNVASAELRFAALMTSKWLSFGRLLFSPAHEEAMSGTHTRILIIDGLGKEWSYNCALTYPNCQFYNLGPEPNSSAWETLSNHHHVTHPSISAPFPFPNNYFSAVVFRFPVAAADDAYQSCFNEIKRTLRPSGYLEMSVLDLDLVNMGHTARKAIRDLKIRMHQQDSQISLWNHGDAFLTLLGKREFENLRKCVVGIPVAGRIRRSHDSGSSSSGGGGGGDRRQKRDSEQLEPEYLRFTEWMQSSGNENDREDDKHRERRNDEDITKTVAKIGRWWYSSCYPDPGQTATTTTTTGTAGLWDTPGLLRECERQRTSFRLLFCYAQNPVCVKRRTASV